MQEQKTNIGLVKYVENALLEKWAYCWGTYGQVLTPKLLGNMILQYDDNARHKSYLLSHINGRVSDCYGLVKGYLWTNDAGNIIYNPKQDFNTSRAFLNAKEKGPLASIPEIPGIILWMNGHVGVYIGKNEFVECAGTPAGTVKGTIKDGKVTKGSRFTHWFKDNNIMYLETKKETVVNDNPDLSRNETPKLSTWEHIQNEENQKIEVVQTVQNLSGTTNIEKLDVLIINNSDASTVSFSFINKDEENYIKLIEVFPCLGFNVVYNDKDKSIICIK